MTLPRIYRFVIKYITPLFLVFLLGFWLVVEGIPVLLLKHVAGGDKPIPDQDVPYVIVTRIGLVVLFVVIVALVWIVWRRKKQNSLVDSSGELNINK
jgi:uncharacterized BrkB/YihY/UPF0761 family membrane protein